MVKGGRENWCGFFHQVFRGITGKKGRPGLAALPVISGRYLRARHPGSPVRYDPDQDQSSRPSPGHHARSVHRTVIACAGQKSLHKKHMQQSWLFSGYTPSPLIDTKTPIEQRSTHRCFAWQWRDRLREVRIDVHLSPYRCCGSDFHERAPVTRARRDAPGFLSELFGYLL